mmetsp:Transcript_2790/g.7057  ORF Transcript_2790/g.7057 Transcript_2790/m.7057 type:complete len:89 (-) Transcript_2790:300-566(-)
MVSERETGCHIPYPPPVFPSLYLSFPSSLSMAISYLLLSLYPSPPSLSTPIQSTLSATISPCGKTSTKYPSGSLINANPFIPPAFGLL